MTSPWGSKTKEITGGVKLIYTGGHISLAVTFKGPNVGDWGRWRQDRWERSPLGTSETPS